MNKQAEPFLAEAAVAALKDDFTPLTDLRASAAYRQRAAGNLLRRFWLETRIDAPLPAHQSSVWARLSPSPLWGEGRGEGPRTAAVAHCTPLPEPSPNGSGGNANPP